MQSRIRKKRSLCIMVGRKDEFLQVELPGVDSIADADLQISDAKVSFSGVGGYVLDIGLVSEHIAFLKFWQKSRSSRPRHG